ncbi:MAG: glycosyltransferase family 4 protein [Muribaculaceae bacterium]|nr:glycosyltransferase family 4 protein [Muribaculaceae bacterium]
MKIAINCAFYQPKGGGIKEYIDNLVNNLGEIPTKHDFIIYVLKDQLEYAKERLPKKFRFKTIPFNSGSKLNRIKRSLFEQNFWLKEEEIEQIDIFHSPFFHAPKLKKAKLLLTVHDLRLYRFPETYEFFRYHFLKNKVRNSIKRANHIISISNFTKEEIVALCDVSADKITVVHEAINPERFSSGNISDSTEIPEVLKKEPFILSVGHMEPRKNYERLIEAFTIIKKNKDFRNLQLVIVGRKDHSFESVLKMIEEDPDIHYLNFVEYNTLLWLYKNARLFVFPSYYEGFGFPPLEAASLETISVVSNVSSIPEVCGDSALYFNPFNIKEMADAIQKGLTDMPTIISLEAKLRSNVERFSWRKNALETIKVYDELK